MSKVIPAVLAMLAAGAISSSPADAAWTCSGPSVACSDSGPMRTAKSGHASSVKSAYKVRSAHKANTARKVKVAISSSKRKHTASSRGSKANRVAASGGSSGIASYYWQGTRTASGARFNPNGLTAAHRSLPFGTRVLVTNHNNGRSVTVTINDRGPFIKGRVIDLSRGAAQVIGMTGSGIARVSYTVVGRG